MPKNTLNLLVDFISYLLVVALICTGILLRYVLPPGSGRGQWQVWGLTRHEWGTVHFWMAAIAVVVLVVHVVLHWNWVWAIGRTLLRQNGRPSRAGRIVGAVAVLGLTLAGLGLFWWSAARQVQPHEAARQRGGGHQATQQQRFFGTGVRSDQPAVPPVQRRWRGGRGAADSPRQSDAGAFAPEGS